MKKIITIVILIFFLFFCFNFKVFAGPIKSQLSELLVGITPIKIKVSYSEGDLLNKGIVFVCLHDDENIAVKAAVDIIKNYGGKLIELIYSDDNKVYESEKYYNIPKIKRYIIFKLKDNGPDYFLDPNRMFTDNGRKHSKWPQNYNNNIYACAAVETFVLELLDKYILDKKQTKYIIALHNNQGLDLDNDSIKLVLKEKNINKKNEKYDFVFVTEKYFFDEIKKANLTVGLQNNILINTNLNNVDYNDGSLSVYCALVAKLPYINVEVCDTYGNPEYRQIEIVKKIINIIINKPFVLLYINYI